MFSQKQQNRFGNSWNCDESAVTGKINPPKRSFYGNNRKFFYHDVAQKKGKQGQKKNNTKFSNSNNNRYNFNKKNRNLYYAKLLQKTSVCSLEEQLLFERLWKDAVGQKFANQSHGKQEKKNCCCHCQCGNPSGLTNRSEQNKISMLRSLMGADDFRKKTMKSVVR